MTGVDLEIAAVRARVAHHAHGVGLRFDGRGSRWLLSSPGESFIVVAPAGGGYVTLVLPLVVAEEFADKRLRELLSVVSEYDVSLRPEAGESLEPGEAYLNLGLRLFLEGLNSAVFRLAVENLRAARRALAAAFP